MRRFGSDDRFGLRIDDRFIGRNGHASFVLRAPVVQTIHKAFGQRNHIQRFEIVRLGGLVCHRTSDLCRSSEVDLGDIEDLGSTSQKRGGTGIVVAAFVFG